MTRVSAPVLQPPADEAPPRRQGFRRASQGLGLEVWVGGILLVAYVVVAVSAIVVFGSSLATLPTNPAWVPPFHPIPPSWTHPFGVLPGLGTGIFRGVWQATPWDLAIITAILTLDGGLALLLGSLGGLHPRGWTDGVVTFVSDTIGSIPSVILVMVFLVGISIVDPVAVNLWLFVLVFGIVLWPTAARAVRERARVVAAADYVEASRASGANSPRILFRHVIPASVGPVLAQLPIDLTVIFLVLSVFPWYTNCVVPAFVPTPAPYPIPILPPISPLPSVNFPEWGNLLGLGVCWGFGTPAGPVYWWMFLFPLLAIVVFGVALGLFCDGLEKWLSVRA